jgi:hypothetical protein
MALAIHRAAASSHGQAHDGPVALISDDPVLFLDGGQKLPEKEILVAPAGHVEVAVPDVAGIGTAGVGHDDDHFAGLARRR